MIHIKNLREGLPVYDALDSEVRISILELLREHGELNLDYFAKALKITNGAVTSHVRKLADAGLIQIKTASAVRGSQKMCSLSTSKVIVDFFSEQTETENSYKTEVDIGHYTAYSIMPTCGIVTEKSIVGELDDPRYFSFPQRFQACLLWFSSGYIEYMVPNNLKVNDVPTELQISMELASEAPGYSTHYPSDIYFSINGIELGFWTSPGEFNDRRGIFTPKWWFPNLGQYGKLKLLTVNREGSFIDGMKISDVTVDKLQIDYNSNILLRLTSYKDSTNPGGISLFGKNFGDYNAGITVKILFTKEPNNHAVRAQ